MIPQCRRFIGKRQSKKIKDAIRKKFPTIKALAEHINEPPSHVYSLLNGYTASRRLARKIEKAVGEKLFPYTEEK